MEYKDRKKDILDILYANGRVSVLQLAKTLFVSEMTIRRDLSEMEKLALLLSHTGGTKQANCPQDCVLGLPWGSSGLESTLKCSGRGFDPWWGI